MVDVQVRGRCARGDFLRHLRPRALVHRTSIDLSGLTFCDPLGLVGLAAIAEGALARNERVLVRGPRRPEIARYLSRMRLDATQD